MGAIFRVIMTLATTLLAGVGAGEVLDKVAADKVPTYENPYKENGKYNFTKLAWMVGLMALGAFVARKIFKKKII
jgi:hypothetical protein